MRLLCSESQLQDITFLILENVVLHVLSHDQLIVFPLGAASTMVNMRRVSHATVQEMLAGKAVLPCVFTLQTSSSIQPPHLLWTRTRPSAGHGGPQEEVVLSAKGNTSM